MPRLLVLSPWFPFPADNGSRQRAFLLLTQLARHYTVELVAGAQADSPPDVPEPLAALCARGGVTRIPWNGTAGESAGLRTLLSPVPRAVAACRNPVLAQAVAAGLARNPDVVLVLERGMDAFVPNTAFRRFPVVLDGVEVSGWDTLFCPAKETALRERLRRRMTYEKARRYWPARLRRYAALTAVSEPEAQAVRALVGQENSPPVVVARNGITTADFAPRRLPEIVPGRIVYAGSPTYGPNREAVRWFAEAILPRIAGRITEAHLLVTGRYTEADAAEWAGNTRVRMTGNLADMRPILASAAVSVVPLRTAGGGTRLKILQAWAAGVPVVSTTLGAAGLDGASDSAHLLMRDDPEGFADAVVSLLDSPDAAAQMAGRARRLAMERYDAAVVAAPLLDLLERVRR